MSVPKAKRKTDPCPCGSGEQYRYCHGAPEPEAEADLAVNRSPRQLFLWLVVIGAPLAYVAGMFLPSGPAAGTVQVWSEEHGHYHTVDAADAAAGKTNDVNEGAPAAAVAPAATPAATPAPDAAPADGADSAPVDGAAAVPPGPAPPGKVWSPEHGHWHDADGSEVGKELPMFNPSDGMPWDHKYKLERPDEEREGFTWSDAHGHWHPSAG